MGRVFTSATKAVSKDIVLVWLEKDNRKVGHLSRTAVLRQFPNHGLRWTLDDESDLTELFAVGAPFTEILDLLGRTPSSTVTKMLELDLVAGGGCCPPLRALDWLGGAHDTTAVYEARADLYSGSRSRC